MNNYIIWRVVDEYAHHLSWDYKYAGFMFYEDYTGKFQNNNSIYLTAYGIYLNNFVRNGTIPSNLGTLLRNS